MICALYRLIGGSALMLALSLLTCSGQVLQSTEKLELAATERPESFSERLATLSLLEHAEGCALEHWETDGRGKLIVQLQPPPTDQLTNGFLGGGLTVQRVVTWDTWGQRAAADVTRPTPVTAAGLMAWADGAQTFNASLTLAFTQLTLVPEPSGLLLLSAAGLGLRRRRRA